MFTLKIVYVVGHIACIQKKKSENNKNQNGNLFNGYLGGGKKKNCWKKSKDITTKKNVIEIKRKYLINENMEMLNIITIRHMTRSMCDLSHHTIFSKPLCFQQKYQWE